ncbi:transcription factor TFIIIB component [Cordyceps javanica]|uniref:Transcription factor TFIIIB component n=1 Tax=Cordyceps javanica TaxID=43265 RepID=A0A545W9Q7_9HYPO|nr:transcription factor TFIIIB component [Cordyceps javanica]TQW10724.1 transcription factor TFIIIB component [Cordyceps javanica]
MSSMFKKKGAPAFKPKIPSARARPSAPAPAPAPAVKPVEPPTAIDDVVEETPTEASEVQRPSGSASESQPPNEPITPESSQAKRRRSSAASTNKTIQDATTRKALIESSNTNVEVIVEDIPAETHRQAATDVDNVPATRRQTRQRRASQAVQEKPTAGTLQLETPPSTEQQVSASSSEPQSEAQAEASIEVPAEATPNATRTRRRASATGGADGNDGETNTARPRKRTRKSNAADGGAEPATAKPRKQRSKAAVGEKASTRTRRARSTTPDDSENKMVDLQTLKMSDLTRDLHIGKKFSRHDELRERERKARLQAKLNKEGLAVNGGDGSRSATPLGEQAQGVKAGTPGESAAPGGGGGGEGGPAPAGPQFRIVDGQIVVDQSSLVMDRHARAAAAHAGEDMETIEENDFTRLITSSSFMTTSKLRGPNIWTDDETELFYRGLGMFGTEFQMISHMFPGKQRRHVKLKFNREERCNPARVDAALVGEKTTKMDLDEYKVLTGAQFEPVESIMAEQRKIEEGYEAERQRIADEQAEVMRKKREELFADDDAAAAAKKKKKGKRVRQTVEYGLNGEPIINDA